MKFVQQNYVYEAMKNKIFLFLRKNKFQQDGLLILIFLVVIAIGFYPAFDNEFVYWDDQYYVIENILINQPTIDSLYALFTKIISLNYHPLTMISLWLNAFFSGTQNAFPFILTNIIFHFFNTSLVYFFCRQLYKDATVVAILTSLIFAIHPLHVESVVWVSEREDVLYTFFFMTASCAYLRYSEDRNKTWYLIS